MFGTFLKKKTIDIGEPDHCYYCLRKFHPDEPTYYRFDREKGRVLGGAHTCVPCLAKTSGFSQVDI